LLPRLEESLISLRECRRHRQEISKTERADALEVNSLFQALQSLLLKRLLLDRENQLRKPPRMLSGTVSGMPAGPNPAPNGFGGESSPHCVADLYRRHTRR
jgi:hypothetical protein